MIIAPALGSTDAPCGALSVIGILAGESKRYQFYPANRKVVLVDTRIVAQVPFGLLVAGMGDALLASPRRNFGNGSMPPT